MYDYGAIDRQKRFSGVVCIKLYILIKYKPDYYNNKYNNIVFES